MTSLWDTFQIQKIILIKLNKILNTKILNDLDVFDLKSFCLTFHYILLRYMINNNLQLICNIVKMLSNYFNLLHMVSNETKILSKQTEMSM